MNSAPPQPAGAASPALEAKLFYLHWHEAEAKDRASRLVAAGHAVDVHWSTSLP